MRRKPLVGLKRGACKLSFAVVSQSLPDLRQPQFLSPQRLAPFLFRLHRRNPCNVDAGLPSRSQIDYHCEGARTSLLTFRGQIGSIPPERPNRLTSGASWWRAASLEGGKGANLTVRIDATVVLGQL